MNKILLIAITLICYQCAFEKGEDSITVQSEEGSLILDSTTQMDQIEASLNDTNQIKIDSKISVKDNKIELTDNDTDCSSIFGISFREISNQIFTDPIFKDFCEIMELKRDSVLFTVGKASELDSYSPYYAEFVFEKIYGYDYPIHSRDSLNIQRKEDAISIALGLNQTLLSKNRVSNCFTKRKVVASDNNITMFLSDVINGYLACEVQYHVNFKRGNNTMLVKNDSYVLKFLFKRNEDKHLSTVFSSEVHREVY